MSADEQPGRRDTASHSAAERKAADWRALYEERGRKTTEDGPYLECSREPTSRVVRRTAIDPRWSYTSVPGVGRGASVSDAPFFDEIGMRVVGGDFTYQFLSMAKREGRSRIGQANATALPFPRASFDAVVCSETLKHIPDDGAAVAEIRRVLILGDQLFVMRACGNSEGPRVRGNDDRTSERVQSSATRRVARVPGYRACPVPSAVPLARHPWRTDRLPHSPRDPFETVDVDYARGRTEYGLSLSGGAHENEIPSVVHVVPALFDEIRGIVGGGERYAFELARFMSKRVPTTLVSFGERSETWTDGDLTVRLLGHSWHVRGQRSNPISVGLVSALAGASVVHAHQQHIVASSISAILARISRKRVFVSDLGGGGWDISSYVSTDSWYHGHLHISAYSRRIFGHDDNPRAHVIYGGVDSEKFSPGSTDLRRRTVLFVGRLLAHKGIDVLIDAIDEGLSLEIIGRPSDEAFHQLLTERAAGKKVTFRYDVGDEELVAAYRRSACIVLPSVYRDVYGRTNDVPELLGQTLLEGMASGLPAICTDVASMPEIVEDGVTGYIVPPNDVETMRARLHAIVSDRDRAESMGRAARADVIERFTWPRVVDRCLEIYSKSGITHLE